MSECESLVVEERESVCVCERERESWKGGREGEMAVPGGGGGDAVSGELFELIATPSCTGGLVEGVSLTCVAVDAAEEVLWCGGVNGGLATHRCGATELQEIFAFNNRSPEDEDEEQPLLPRFACRAGAHTSAVLGIEPLVAGGRALSVSSSLLTVHDTGLGLCHFQYRDTGATTTTSSASPGDLSCACVLGGAKAGGRARENEVVVGRQTKYRLTVLDLGSGRVVADAIETSSGAVAICSTSRGSIVSGHRNGEVTLRGDGRSGYRVEHTLDAHKGGITAVDVRNDLLVTCGLTMRSGHLQVDTLVKVFDVRNTCRALHHIPFGPGPSMLRFEPRFSSMVLVGGQSGIFSLMDVTLGSSSHASYQVDTEGDLLTCAAFSPTGEAIAFGDGGGFIHLWAGTDMPYMHTYPREPVPASPLNTLLAVSAAEDDSVAIVPLPPPMDGCPLFSENNYSERMAVGLPPRRFNERLAAGMHMRVHDNIGYMPNPEFKRGRPPGEATRRIANVRNLRVERTKDKIEREALERRLKVQKRLVELGIPSLPTKYCRVDVNSQLSRGHKGRMRHDDFDFSKYNKTRFAGLENDLANSYCNALIQVLYFTPKLRSSVLKSCCAQEFCVTCELGFLFHMLHVSTVGIPCQASNMLRALRQIREAGALGLLEGTDEYEAQRDRSLMRRVQALSRFMMEQLHKELARKEHGGSPTAIETLYGITVSSTIQCTSGKHEDHTRESLSFQVELQYPSSSSQPEAAQDRPSFSEILKASLAPRTPMRAWCLSCREYQHVWQQRFPVSLPSVLVINTNIRNPVEEMKWWEPLSRGGRSTGASSLGRGDGDSWLPLRIGIKTTAAAPGNKSGSGSSNDGENDNDADDELTTTGMRTETKAPVCMEVSSNIQVYEGSAIPPDAVIYELTAMIANAKEEELAEFKDARPTDKSAQPDGHIIALARLHPDYVQSERGIGASPMPETPGLSPYPGASAHRREREAEDLSSQTIDETSTTEDTRTTTMKTPVKPSGSSIVAHDDKAQWILFNDFSIQEVDEREVVALYGTQKVPCVLHYTKVDDVSEVTSMTSPMPNSAPSSTEVNFRKQIATPSLSQHAHALRTPRTFRPFNMEEEDRPCKGMLLGIDAEFVMLHPEEKEFRSDGTEEMKRPARLGLARVSVVRGEGSRAGECCIDDYVRTVEPVYDYLHRFSGLEPGDLEPSTSVHHLVSTKTAYMKLRYLIDIGCVFVGHGLKQDFRMLNIVVPPEQVIDTVELFSFKHKRKLSLRFLAAYLLGIDIQRDTHDSIEDARTALKLYRVYERLVAGGEDAFREKLDQIYKYGYRNNWTINEAVPPLE